MKTILRLLCLLPLTLCATEFAEVRRADGEVLKIWRDQADDWSPPTNAAIRFVRVVTVSEPTYDPLLYRLSRARVLTETNLTLDFVAVRLTTNQIVANLRAETERRIKLLVPLDQQQDMLRQVAELLDKQASGAPLSEQETADIATVRSILARTRAIRARAAELTATADTITLVTWPE